MPEPIRVTPVDDGAFVELRLARPPRNILDAPTLEALCVAARALALPVHRRACAILLCADPPSFSAGAAVAEHRRDEVARMLARFGAAIRALLDADLPIVAAVRGHCLGGGLELALTATRIHAAPDAVLGQPEIRLGAFAPLASILLPRRLGQARAEEMLVAGLTVGAERAAAIGLVASIDADPEEAARAWIRAHLTSLSASSLRVATRAARACERAELDARLRALEEVYVSTLAPTQDAEEGICAFLDKRAPRWEHR